jgi:muconolactone delta-isomerase
MQRVVSADLLRTFTPPRELARSRPREVRLAPGGRALIAVTWLLAAAAIVVTVAMQAEARRQSEAAQQMDGRSVVSTATVDRLWRGSGDGKPAFAAFHFDADGTRVDAQTRMRTSTWRSLRVGDKLSILYLPDDPRRFALDGARESGMPVWLPAVIGSALMALALLLGEAVRRQRRLLMEGRPAPAVVTAVRKHHSSHGASHREMTYEFPLLGGGVATGKSQATKGADVGTAVCVVYDPDVPTRNHPYPFSLVKLDAGTTW